MLEVVWQTLTTIASIMIILSFILMMTNSPFPSGNCCTEQVINVEDVLDRTVIDILDKVVAMDSSKREEVQSILDECYCELVNLDKKDKNEE